MLSPEVTNFPVPRSCFQSYECELSAFINKLKKVPRHAQIPPLFRSVKTFIASQGEDDDCPVQTRFPSVTYKINNLPLYLLLETDFREAFIKRGKFMAAPQNPCGLDDWVVVTPEGNLELHLRKDHSQKLGLPPSSKATTEPDHRVFVVNMLDPNFHEGKKHYDVLYGFLKKIFPLKNSMLVKWIPPLDTICTSSLAAYWEAKGVEISVVGKDSSHTIDDTKMPLLEETDPYDMVEWVGSLALEIKESETKDEYVSTFRCPEPNESIPSVSKTEITGLFSAAELADWMTEIEKEWKLLKIGPWANISLFSVENYNPKLLSIFFKPRNQNNTFSCVICQVEENYP